MPLAAGPESWEQVSDLGVSEMRTAPPGACIVEFDDMLAAVGGVADQALATRINYEVE